MLAVDLSLQRHKVNSLVPIDDKYEKIVCEDGTIITRQLQHDFPKLKAGTVINGKEYYEWDELEYKGQKGRLDVLDGKFILVTQVYPSFTYIPIN